MTDITFWILVREWILRKVLLLLRLFGVKLRMV